MFPRIYARQVIESSSFSKKQGTIFRFGGRPSIIKVFMPENDVQKFIDSTRDLLGVEHNKDVAAFLEITPQALYRQRKVGTVPKKWAAKIEKHLREKAGLDAKEIDSRWVQGLSLLQSQKQRTFALALCNAPASIREEWNRLSDIAALGEPGDKGYLEAVNRLTLMEKELLEGKHQRQTLEQPIGRATRPTTPLAREIRELREELQAAGLSDDEVREQIKKLTSRRIEQQTCRTGSGVADDEPDHPHHARHFQYTAPGNLDAPAASGQDTLHED